MGRVISTLDRAQRDGHCHALLESPTGTGKSLSLLCSALAWQKNYRPKNMNGDVSNSKPDPEALSDPLGHGGGFVPETEPSRGFEILAIFSKNQIQHKNVKEGMVLSLFLFNKVSNILKHHLVLRVCIPAPENSEPASAANGKNKKKKRKPTIFYASRTHTQISQVIREYRKTAYRVPMAVLVGYNLASKLLVRDQDFGCPEFKNMHKVKGHPSLQKGGCHEAHDIEDLVKVGQVVKGCAYYAARDMADNAQLVFCPYSYIINPVIRGAMELDIEGAILILDEAHNIEDMARDAGSVDVEEDVLHSNHFVCHIIASWTGDKALRELQEANISQQSFPILQECARKAIKAAIDIESRVAHLSGMSVITLEGLYSALSYFFSENGLHTVDYQLALQRYVKKMLNNIFRTSCKISNCFAITGSVAGSWTCTFSLWCLNPAVVFRGIADLSLSVILTSGTLSPMHSFSSELGVQFGTCLEAPHVIDIESQLWAAIFSTSPGCTWKIFGGNFKIVPGGTLVFFPSYKLMEKLCSRWRETEPRGGSQDDFEPILKAYYESVRRGTKPTLGRKRRTKKMDLSQSDEKESQDNSKKKGAAFLQFSEERFQKELTFLMKMLELFHDIQVAQKKKYNDMYKSSKDLLSGNEWYCHQAFRALNQAAGRCYDIGTGWRQGCECLQSAETNVQEILSMDQIIGSTRKKNQKLKKPDHGVPRLHLQHPAMTVQKYPLSKKPLSHVFIVVTPERDFIANTSNMMPETESPLNLSVNSHAQKRRKSMILPSVNPTQAEHSDAPDAKTPGHIGNSMATRDANRRIEFGFGMDKQLQIFCSLCRNPLGLPENDLYVMCSLTSSSKVHLASLLRGSLESLAVNTSTSIPVVVSDSSSVNQRLCNKTLGGAQEHGVWCEEDGCVFNTIYCPFCSTPNNCLGVQIMATNASNVELLNKILFYFDRLEIKNPEASTDKGIKNPESSADKDLSPPSGSNSDEVSVHPFEKFSYKPQEPQQNSNGWRTTKSKLRLPKSSPLSNSRSQCGTQTGSYEGI
ncbi:Fanconi anemia group J protein-like [Vitis vinifera]|uniref:Fanconi anemia group J protein-like n=1 Tax=Vitis vinifera TaxID=29760 RepID=A0A438K445_VITVI|nr:Fanconi anemia group J protein-like [Vitis vinifera]